MNGIDIIEPNIDNLFIRLASNLKLEKSYKRIIASDAFLGCDDVALNLMFVHFQCV